jgi:hypothetical protein
MKKIIPLLLGLRCLSARERSKNMIGTIIAFAGPSAKVNEAEGYLLCDGRDLPRGGEYGELFAIIGTLHGAGDGVNTFNIPDYRGYFLRGVSGATDIDPEKNLRTAARPGGSTGNEVGTSQSDATAMPNNHLINDTHPGHSHGDPTWNGGPGPYELATVYRGPGGYDYGAQSAPTTVDGKHTHTISGGDRETRPVNKYVHWLIKAR